MFFHTGCVQMSEAVAHLMLAIAQHGDVQRRLHEQPDDDLYLDRVVTEALRLFPLFGIAHRITSKACGPQRTHTCTDRRRTSRRLAARPSRAARCCASTTRSSKRPVSTIRSTSTPTAGWTPTARSRRRVPGSHHAAQHCNYIPFGVKESRPCPAQNASLIWLKACARVRPLCRAALALLPQVLLRHAEYASPVDHARSLLDRGHVAVLPHGAGGARAAWLMARIGLVELALGAVRSVQQLVFGTYMLVDARRQRLAAAYFARSDVYA